MCGFFSYIIWNRQNVFLLPAVIKSQEFQRRAKEDKVSPDDYLGHWTIRWWHRLQGGESFETRDYSSPVFFPDDVVAAVRNGEYRGLAIMPDMLTEKAKIAYYSRRKNSFLDHNRLELRREMAAYESEIDEAFWDLFAISENRLPAWR